MADTNNWNGKLHVYLDSAADVKNADAFGKSDPYCICKVFEGEAEIATFRTRTIDDNLNPRWAEDFFIKLKSKQKVPLKITFTIYDDDPVGADFLGEAAVTFSTNDTRLGKLQKEKLVTKKGEGSVTGEVRYRISHYPQTPVTKLEHDTEYTHPNGKGVKIHMGPVLIFRGLFDCLWSVGAVVVLDKDSGDGNSNGDCPNLSISPSPANGVTITKLVEDATRVAYVYDFAIKQTHETLRVNYAIFDRKNSFFVPASQQPLKFTACSCNGFHADELKAELKADEYFLWKMMTEKHRKEQYNLILQGGDQVYADRLWAKVPELAGLDAGDEKGSSMPFTDALEKSLTKFYMDLYVDNWKALSMAKGLASIPSVMMWDDHDIFDGWGSYETSLLHSSLYQGIYKVAERFFLAFQMGSVPGKLPAGTLKGKHRSKTQTHVLGNTGILALDLRSERTKHQVMHPDTYTALDAWFNEPKPGLDHLVVISSIPAVYNDFSVLETLISGKGLEVEDDLLDHWRAADHNAERLKLFKKLFTFAEKNSTRVTLLSGDVHIGALGVLEDKKGIAKSNTASINSLVTSAIVNAPPSPTLINILATNALTVENINSGDDKWRASLVKFPPNRTEVYIPKRNFLEMIGTVTRGVICNWISEDVTKQYCFFINPPTDGAAGDLPFPK